MTDAELVARYDGRVPRYTSYPTAPHFTAGGRRGDLRRVAAGPARRHGSVALSARAVLRPAVPLLRLQHHGGAARFVAARLRRAARARDRPRRGADRAARAVSHVHWGGGTPTRCRAIA